jgi:hypothetical protein
MLSSEFWKWFEREVKEQMEDCACDERIIRRHLLRMWLFYSPVAGYC